MWQWMYVSLLCVHLVPHTLCNNHFLKHFLVSVGSHSPPSLFAKVESCQLEFHDDNLSTLLELTTADLRFISFLVQHVGEAAEGDIASTSWEGSEDWLRAQFRLYLLSLLTTTLESGMQPDGN